MPIIFTGDETTAYRDPTCFYLDGQYHLFFTISQKEDGYIYNFIGHSISTNLNDWSKPKIITEKNKEKNFCSPGNIIEHNGGYIICFCSYPLKEPYDKNSIADDSARLFTMQTSDFKTFSSPKKIYAKGKNCSLNDEGRMIDPYIFKRKNKKGYCLFFKQNGVSISESEDLENWEYKGKTDGGENACVIEYGGKYLLIHSPENGVGFMQSDDLVKWKDIGHTTLMQNKWKWADGRLTAAYAMKNMSSLSHKYIMFFHGSKKDIIPEIHGGASLAFVLTDDFKTFVF